MIVENIPTGSCLNYLQMFLSCDQPCVVKASVQCILQSDHMTVVA